MKQPMAAERHLTKAPIAEAIIELHVAPSERGNLDAGRRFSDSAKDLYPKIEKRVEGRFSLKFGPKGAESSDNEAQQIGFRMISENGLRVINVTKSVFSYHQLKPYSHWEDLKGEALRLWKIYASEYSPAAVTRIGVRFINRLSIPLDGRDLTEYLVPGPVVPDGLPQTLQSFLSRIEISDEPNERVGIIALALEGLNESGQLSVVLDLDVVKQCAIKPNVEQIWEIVDSARALKNRMFFLSVTDRLLEQYA